MASPSSPPPPPECPICLNPYSYSETVPLVLSCGHSVCRPCLLTLPHPSPTPSAAPSAPNSSPLSPSPATSTSSASPPPPPLVIRHRSPSTTIDSRPFP
ncbi:hypothetical protein QJS10_CPA08g01066 [Acorus calamus]|uniref:RING-type domain-containing protein n=1 Tax=Acorus calamus TaxID=4465 RepID=A0AAV9E934_ACOCL|nr:hypothetical protein QJS10_CPA08g01066 [Acorus calamus]